MAYTVTFNGVTLDVQNISMTTSCEYDSSMRPTNATTTVDLKGKNTRSFPANQQMNEPYVPLWGLDTGVGDYGRFVLTANGTTIINKPAKLIAATSDNSSDPSSSVARNYTTQYVIYEENDIFPGEDSIKNVSSISYKFESSIGDEYGSYTKPSTVPGVSNPKLLDETDGSEEASSVYTVSISAVGINTHNGNNSSNANAAIDTIEAFDDIPARLDLTGSPYDKISKTTTDGSAGSVTKVITYTKYDNTANYRDSYDVTINEDNRNMDSYTTVTINGTIKGLNTAHDSDFGDNRSSNARLGLTETLVTIDSRAKKALTSINQLPISKKYDRQPQGVINYSHTYDTRPLSLVSGAISEDLAMSDDYQRKEKSHLPVLGGVSLQNFGTYTIPSRTVTYTAQFPRGYSTGSVEGLMDNAIDQFDPKKISTSTNTQIASRVESESLSRDVTNNKITKTKKWIYYVRES